MSGRAGRSRPRRAESVRRERALHAAASSVVERDAGRSLLEISALIVLVALAFAAVVREIAVGYADSRLPDQTLKRTFTTSPSSTT